jgi:uncharacterized phage protein (TIGR01671 family)
MRKIKFRAWDAKKKEMLEMFLDDIGPGFLMDFFCNAFEAQMPGENNVKIMQFTGLLDKNGKEIYEGDIVNARIYGDDPFNPQPIYYEGSAFWVDYKFPDFDRTSLCCFPEGVEIIGNIYENPEFLNA